MRTILFSALFISFTNTSIAQSPATPKSNRAEPFDLKYLPRKANEVQLLIGLRPAAILASPAARPLGADLNAMLLQVASVIGIKGGGPGLENIESLVICGHISVGPNTDPRTNQEHPASLTAGASGGVIRTVKPFDWSAAVRGWFPSAAVVTHEQAKFHAVAIPEQFLPPGMRELKCRIAFYSPDDRTLVIDGEDAIRELIDRVKVRSASAAPPGWDRVARSTIAVAIDNRDRRWVHHLPKHAGPEMSDPANVTFQNADHFALGLDLGATTRLRVASYSANQFLGADARRGLKALTQRFAKASAPEPEEASPAREALAKSVSSLLRDGAVTPRPLGFEYDGEVKDDLLKRLIDVVNESKPKTTSAPAPMRRSTPGY